MVGYPDTLYDLNLYGQVFTKIRTNSVNTYQNPELKKKSDIVDISLLPLVHSFHILNIWLSNLLTMSVHRMKVILETRCADYISTFVLLLRIVGGRDRMVNGFTTTYAVSAYHR